MIKGASVSCAAVLSMLGASPVAAQEIEPVEIERVRDRDEVELDPDASYLLVQGNRFGSIYFYKVPSEELRAQWIRQRDDEIAEQQADYERDMRRYESNMRRYRPGPGALPPPEEPVYATVENFAWPDIETQQMIAIGPGDRFYDEAGLSMWLYEVPPGEYVFYGVADMDPRERSVVMDCACMGSVAFNVEPGRITAIRAGVETVDASGAVVDFYETSRNRTDRDVWRTLVAQPPTEAAFDPRLPRERITVPGFRPIDRLENWLGGTINRVQPIPGVLGYERDQLIDLRSQATLDVAEENPAEAEAG